MTTPGRYSERVAVVTGAGSGIGAATARQLLAEGAQRVHVMDVDSDAVQQLARDLNDPADGRLEPHVADVRDPSSWRHLREVLQLEGRLDLLVNNAYTAVVLPIDQQSSQQWDLQLGVNLTSHYHAMTQLLPLLLRSAGAVVNVSSVHASIGVPGYPAYAATKGAVQALSRQLAVEYGPDLRVNTVSPGPVLTGAWRGAEDHELEAAAAATAVGRLGRPEEIAEAICFLGSDAASFITGSDLAVDGGWLARKDSP